MAGRCKPTLQNLKQFYKAWDKFTFWKTFLHIIKQNYITITHLRVPKQIYISENKLTRRKTLLQCTNSEIDGSDNGSAQFWWSSWWPKIDSDRVVFCPFCGNHMSRLTRLSFSCGRSLEFLNGADQTEGPDIPQQCIQYFMHCCICLWSLPRQSRSWYIPFPVNVICTFVSALVNLFRDF